MPASLSEIPWIADEAPHSYWITGDTRSVLARLPDSCVDMALTSPPFWTLRSYLPSDHANKALEMGSEPTPGEFIDGLLDLTESIARVLTPTGSLCVELGDTSSGSGGGGGDYLPGGLRDGQPGFAGSAQAQREGNAAHWRDKNREPQAWPLAKSLCMIPESYRWALAYGRNPFTGRETERWRVRNVVRWGRSNPPVGSLGDKFRRATTDMVVACKSAQRFFDLDAVRTPAVTMRKRRPGAGKYGDVDRDYVMSGGDHKREDNPGGVPPHDYWWDNDAFEQDLWDIPTEPFKGSHYATFPRALAVRPIRAMCPQAVCRVCGEPSRRVTEDNPELAAAKAAVGGKWQSGGLDRGLKRPTGADRIDVPGDRITIGWTDCGCCGSTAHTKEPGKCGSAHWRPGVVLDPFGGSGTVGQVAIGNGRSAVLIDLDESNLDLARQRIGMFLTEVEI